MSKPSIGIIDSKIGNLFSVMQMCEHVGFQTHLVSEANSLAQYDGIVLPGVGAFGEAMTNLKSDHMDEAILSFVKTGKPMLGVCLGMQLLFSESEEFGSHLGLNLIPGKIKKFDKSQVSKVPQIAWNKIYHLDEVSWKDTILNGIPNNEYMYFVHSYYVLPDENKYILSKTSYDGFEYCSSIKKDNIEATQFHPEKSGQKGEKIYKNWRSKF